mmetsp:Transcript_127406/g.220913  ORF Transcript_127406/g.220913 Transcript_127406/m.220913 type:complete len:662 (+) Transcript_127406:148-2133(+)
MELPPSTMALGASNRESLQGSKGCDAEQVVSFLCRKFSMLIDRTQKAEERHSELQQLAADLEGRRAEAAERRSAARAPLQSAVDARRSEAERLQHKLREVRMAASLVLGELDSAREGAKALKDRCEALNERYEAEQRDAKNAASAVARSDEEWEACERERTQLRDEASTVGSSLATMEEELALGKEQERHRKASIRALEDKLNEAGRARLAAEQKAEAQHDELCSATRQVTVFRARLEAARHTLLLREEELRAEDDRLAELRTENRRHEQEVAGAQLLMQQLQEAQAAFEKALRVNVEKHDQLRAVQELRRIQSEAVLTMSGKQQELQRKLADTADRHAAAEADCGRCRQRLQILSSSIKQGGLQRDHLQQDTRGAGSAGESLRAELQCIFADTEQLRRERDEAVSTSDELSRRVKGVEPALEAARKRVQELEDLLEETQEQASRARGRKEGLVREVSQGRDKMRGLRRRHERLSERAQSFERRFVRNSGSLSGTAGFAAAAAAVSPSPHPSRRHAGSSSKVSEAAHTGSRPLEPMPTLPGADMGQVMGSFSSRGSGGGLESSSDANGLGYVRHWIELEEARLSMRTPPQPTPVPASAQGAQMATTPKRGMVTAPAAMGSSSSPPRSAAALSALRAGASPAEVVALLNGAGTGQPLGLAET